MTQEQAQAMYELIRIAQVVSVTAAGIRHYLPQGGFAVIALLDMESRLDDAAEAARQALATPQATVAQMH